MTPELIATLKADKAELVALLEQFAGTLGSYPLSYAQASLWSLHQLNPESAAYNVTYAIQLDDAVESATLRRCVDYLIARHPILRTAYRVIDGEPCQEVVATAAASLAIDRLFDADEAAIRHWIDDQANQPFDLAQSPIRLKLLVNVPREAQGIRQVLLINVHHIAADFRSLEILIRELHALYAQAVAGAPLALPPLALQYRDCVQHELARLGRGASEPAAAFWRHELRDGWPVLELATDRVRPPLKSERGRVHELALGEALSARVRDAARQAHVTPYMWLLTVYQLFLYCHTGQPRLMIGAPTSGRGVAGSENVLGHFVNTVVLACDVNEGDTFSTLLDRTREMMLRVLEHQDYPFPMLVDMLRPPRDASRSPIYQVMFNWNQAHGETGLDAAGGVPFYGARLAASSTGTRGATHDLTLNLQDLGNAYLSAWTFNTDLFEPESIERFARQYVRLVEQALEDPARALARFSTADQQSGAALMARLARVLPGSPAALSECATTSLDASAVVWQLDGAGLTRADVDAARRALTARLASAGVAKGTCVALHLTAPAQCALALLAVCELGARVLRTTIGLPRADDAWVDPRVGVTLLDGGTPDWHPASIRIEAARQGAHVRSDDTRDAMDAGAVMAFTADLARLLRADRDSVVVALCDQPAWLTVASLVHAFSRGGSVRLSSQASISALASPDASLARAARATLGALLSPAACLMVPALLATRLADAGIDRVRHRLVYGDRPGGASGSTVFVPLAAVEPWHTLAGFVPDRGRWRFLAPSADGRVAVVVGPTGRLADERQAGELRFVWPAAGACDIASPPDSPDALLDGAVPLGAGLRAVRIGETILSDAPSLRGSDASCGVADAIERHLRGVPGVQDAACEAREVAGAVVRVAYLTPDPALADSGPDALLVRARAALKAALPDAMHPDAIQWLAQLPLDARGALDVSRLPLPDAQPGASREADSEIEHALVAIWRDVLGRATIGVDDDFFESGGDSILAAVIVSRAALDGLYLKPKDLFEHTTVAELAAVVQAAPALGVDQGPVRGDAALGPAAAWFVEKVDRDRSHFNQALLVSLRDEPDLAMLAEAWRVVVQHHDGLRSRFAADGASLRQHFPDTAGDDGIDVDAVSCVDAAGRHDEAAWRAAIAAAQTGLDIERGRLLAVRWLKSASLWSSRLLIVVHHLAIDGVSWAILLQDLADAYLQIRQRTTPKLPLKTSAAKAWVEHWQALVATGALDRDRAYWLARAEHVRAALGGGTRVALMRHSLNPIVHHTYEDSPLSCTITLDAKTTTRLRTTAHRAYGTDANDLLVAALHGGFWDWSRSEALWIDVEGHGRNAFDDEALDLSRSIGWFTSIYPVFVDAPADGEAARLIKGVKQRLREVPRHGAGFGALRYLDGDATLAALPAAPILFTYLGQLEQMAGNPDFYRGTLEAAPGIRSPRQRRTHLLDIVAYVAGGRLILDASFHGAPGVDESIGCLMCHVEARLRALIDHCDAAPDGGMTPSDVPQLDVDQDELDAVLAEIDALEP
ncbi:condensation domain-containing protein [Burkholderia sp. Ac-20379]|uniref:condensation domain-containing protein n=1 Tax=Burkholderia sp. Ac-20379 TaxID=2703900 RepID=UPI001F1211B1|nr:condensation domain-containing protein [Burkholderia sp. Ac-20379]